MFDGKLLLPTIVWIQWSELKYTRSEPWPLVELRSPKDCQMVTFTKDTRQTDFHLLALYAFDSFIHILDKRYPYRSHRTHQDRCTDDSY
jgi:hypothetical protein